MAKILSQVDTIRRGSVGGITYTANQWAQIIARARTAPVNPSTPFQTTIRSALSNVSAQWEIMTQDERDAWSAYAQTVIFTGPLGQYQITGRLMFIRCLALPLYCNSRGLIVLALDDEPPVVPGAFNAGPLNPVPPAGPAVTGIGLSIGNQTGEDGVAFVERSVAFAQTRERYKGPFLSTLAVAEDITAGVSTVISFTGLTVDMVYFTYTRMFTKVAPFRLSSSYVTRHIAETVV